MSYKSAEKYLHGKLTMETYTNFKQANSEWSESQRDQQETVKTEEKPVVSYPLQQRWEKKRYTTLSDPKVWGPPFWMSLHISAANYPIKATKNVAELMKNRIRALAIELPCQSCRPHAYAFISDNEYRLDHVCSGRDALFDFFVDFHNKVNSRYNKPLIGYEEARELWMNGTDVYTLTIEKAK